VLVLTLFAAALAAARLARLVADDEITVGFRRMIVRRFGPTGWLTKLIHCAPWCMSMWFSVLLPVAVFWHNQWVLAALSIPAGSMAAAIFLRMADRE
jgi:hypothetical protein